jgi:hypothetical protein
VVLAVVVCNNEPELIAEYHRNVPEVAEVAVSDTGPLPQRETLVADGCAGTAFIVAVTAARVLLTHVPLSNST